MRSIITFCAAAVIFSLSSCDSKTKSTTVETTPTSIKVKDIHSAAIPEEAVVTHLDWSAEVDMSNHIITATATWSIKTSADAKNIVFDTRGLNISKIWLDNDTTSVKFNVADLDSITGSALTIPIQTSNKTVSISYQTSPDAEALQWLSPSQTAGKIYPFLFTQSQAILARTWIPCQDSPGIRFTYDAEVLVAPNFQAVMSAINPTDHMMAETNHGAKSSFKFHQPKPIPAYLMALAVGKLEFQPIGERTGVYAESATIKQAVYEFADMEKMLVAAEKLYGKYAWNRYDVLVLPPSFPFGGMENPELTFATPTILAGDRSLVSLIAHELAHSWSGNLVTNATWDDFWLNEGFTVYFERRIMESIEGPEYAQMLASLGYSDLEQTLADFKAEGLDNDTKLKLDLKGRNPDDGVSDIAYEKGYLLLCRIEKTVGREKFDEFLRNYFHEFAFKTMTTEDFIVYINKKLLTTEELKTKVNLEQWIYQIGLPADFHAPISSRFTAVEKEAENFLNGTIPVQLQTTNWSSHEWQHFLRFLSPKLDAAKMASLDATFHFTTTGNSEVAAVWLGATIKHHYKPAYAKLEEFLMNVGRRKFVKPLYEAMMKDAELKPLAISTYKSARPNYHAVTTGTLDQIVRN